MMGVMLNRRGFISSLAGLVAWVKSGNANSISPAASAIQPTCEKQDYLLELNGMACFPVYGMDGNLTGETAYYVERGASSVIECVYVNGSLFDCLRALPSLPTKSMADLNRRFRLTDNRNR